MSSPSPSPHGGPRTPEGKARSARNALRHGLRARSFALAPDEDPAEWALHLAVRESKRAIDAYAAVLRLAPDAAALKTKEGWRATSDAISGAVNSGHRRDAADFVLARRTADAASPKVAATRSIRRTKPW